MNIALDIIAVAIVAASVLLGIKKGFLKTVLALAGMILVFFLAYKLSVPLGNVIDEKIVNPSLRGTASSRIADKIGVELQEGDKEAQLENFEAEIEQKNESEEGLTVLGIGREKINQAAQEASGSVVKGIFSLHPVAWTMCCFGTSGVMVQIMDRLPAWYHHAKGLPREKVVDSCSALCTCLEEGGEMMIAIFALVAIVQAHKYYTASRDARGCVSA